MTRSNALRPRQSYQQSMYPVTSIPPSDGYALASRDLPSDGTKQLVVVGSSFAGKPFDGKLAANQAVRIMTGAVVPQGADLVVMQEHANRDGDNVIIDNRTKPGDNVRAAGEDIKIGEEVLAAGSHVGPAELGLIASLGIEKVAVKRQVRVAFVSTGDELKGVGQALAPGEIYDSNRYTLFGMLKRMNVEIIDLGVVVDETRCSSCSANRGRLAGRFGAYLGRCIGGRSRLHQRNFA